MSGNRTFGFTPAIPLAFVFRAVLATAAAAQNTTTPIKLSYDLGLLGQVFNGAGALSPYGANSLTLTLPQHSLVFTFPNGDSLTANGTNFTGVVEGASGSADFTGGTSAFAGAGGSFKFEFLLATNGDFGLQGPGSIVLPTSVTGPGMASSSLALESGNQTSANVNFQVCTASTGPGPGGPDYPDYSAVFPSSEPGLAPPPILTNWGALVFPVPKGFSGSVTLWAGPPPLAQPNTIYAEVVPVTAAVGHAPALLDDIISAPVSNTVRLFTRVLRLPG
jgi:hypothetical protein